MALADLPDIYFIRHGETDWNAEGRYQGQKDIPLNLRGQGQADANGRLLRDLLVRDGRTPAMLDWFSSPLSRTRETMRRVRTDFNLDENGVVFDPRLMEVSFGIFEGSIFTELPEEAMPRVGSRDKSFWNFRPEAGESYEDVADRLRPFFAELSRPSVVVAHGGIARVFRHIIEDMSKRDAVNWPIRQDAIMYFSQGTLTICAA